MSCIEHSDLVKTVQNVIATLNQAGSGNGNGSCNGNGNGSGSGTDQSKIQTQLMVDMASLSSVERPISTGTVVTNVLTYYTQNEAPIKLDRATYQFDWMGIARLYLSPLNLGLEHLQESLAGSYAVDWIRVKLINVTFSKSSASSLTELDASTDNVDQPAKNELFTLDGTTYTIGYRPAAFLEDNEQIETSQVGNAFLKRPESDTSTFYGIGFTTPNITGVDSQYKGEYACEWQGSKTERLGTASELIIRNPSAATLSLTSTTTANGAIANEYGYSTQVASGYTVKNTAAFQTKQGTANYDGKAATPVYGLVQIDLPEDLVQDIYERVSTDTILDSDTDEDSGLSTLQRIYLRKTVSSVLNANYKILVEYAFRSS